MSWAAIPGFIGKYAVSDRGEVMSMNFARSGLPGLLENSVRAGYPSVMLGRRQHTVHSLVCAAFLGPRPAGMVINHKDGDKTNNRLSNLEYVTHSENAKHAHRTGLQSNRGEKHSQARLTEDNVVQILDHLSKGRRTGEIAREFGVHQSQISHIKSGRSWPHLSRKAG